MSDSLRAGLFVTILIASAAILFLGAHSLAKSLKKTISEEEAVCVKNGQRAITVADPAYFMRGGTGPKVLCVKD